VGTTLEGRFGASPVAILRLAAVLRAGMLFFLMQVLIAAYHDVLFRATLASL
jgi:hypothetical protein